MILKMFEVTRAIKNAIFDHFNRMTSYNVGSKLNYGRGVKLQLSPPPSFPTSVCCLKQNRQLVPIDGSWGLLPFGFNK